MPNGGPPRRMRHSWEARCRLVVLIQEGMAPAAAGQICGISRASAYRLWRRYCEGGYGALRDRPPIAHGHPRRLSAEAEAQILELRRRTGWGPARLGALLGRPASTIWRVLRRHGQSRRQAAARPPANRYEYAAPGELVHLDIKRLGRFWQLGKRVLGGEAGHLSPGAGWQYLHVAVDDHSRYVVAKLLPGQGSESCARFLEHVVLAFAERGISIERLLTDNGSGDRSHRFSAACDRHGISHRRTRPYRPRTNGKAEAFIGIAQREWAYAHAYHSSAHRARALPGYLRWYNRRRPHGSLGKRPPISRLGVSVGVESYT